MMPNVWLKFQAPIVMRMVVVAPSAIATSHVHIEKKEKNEGMRREKEKRKGHFASLCFFFSDNELWGT